MDREIPVSVRRKRLQKKLLITGIIGTSLITIFFVVSFLLKDSLSLKALVNILKNAYEAIEQNGMIQIITLSAPSRILIRNNGPELSEEVNKNLFVPFFSTKPGGQGIGLMIVREILRNHHVNFRFYSENGWTCFEITF